MFNLNEFRKRKSRCNLPFLQLGFFNFPQILIGICLIALRKLLNVEGQEGKNYTKYLEIFVIR